jgi:predicted RNase H-like HicB family nuclease/DNA-binding XRE family transcriptional regulator
MRLRYRVRYYEEEGWWMAEIPDVARGTATQGRTPQKVRHMARDAVTMLLFSQHSHGEPLEPPSSGDLPEGWKWVYPEARVELAWMIRQERKSVGLTMQQAADRLGVSFSAYQRWEDPERCNATISTMERIAEALGRQLQFGFARPEAS